MSKPCLRPYLLPLYSLSKVSFFGKQHKATIFIERLNQKIGMKIHYQQTSKFTFKVYHKTSPPPIIWSDFHIEALIKTCFAAVRELA